MQFKKFIALMSAGLVLAFSSCGTNECESVKLEKDISFHGKITEDNSSYEADFKRVDGAGWKATFTKPETVKGLELDLFNDTCTMNFKELTYTLKRDEMPKYSMVLLITSAMDDCISGKVKCESNGEKTIERGIVEEQDFIVELKNDKLKAIEISDLVKAEISQ